MKILNILHSMNVGGAEKHLVTLMDGLLKLGVVPIYAGQKDSWLHKEVIKRGYKFYNVPMHGYYDIFSMIKLAVIAKGEKVRLVHGHLTRGAFYAGIVSKLTNIPSIATAHSTNAGKHFGGVNHIIAVSEAVENFLISRGYSPDRITLIYNGIVDQYENVKYLRGEIRTELKLEEKDIALCTVGRFLKDKGQDIIIKAVKECKHNNIRLFLTGDASSSWGEQMKDLVKQQGLEKSVTFLGQVDNVPELLCAMDIVVVPSRREAMPLALLEACSIKKVVVASRVGGIPEVVEHGVNGLLFEAEDVNALTGLIDYAIDNKQKSRQLAANARTTFLNQFTVSHMSEDTKKLYNKVIKEL